MTTLKTNILLTIVIFLLAAILSILVSRLFSKKKLEATANKYNPNLGSVIRDVLIASTTAGQFPLAIVGLVIIVALFVMGGQNTYNIFLQTLNTFKSINFLGWLLFLILIPTSALSIRSIQKSHRKELEYIKREQELSNHDKATSKSGNNIAQVKKRNKR